jgi:hypothetical protein
VEEAVTSSWDDVGRRFEELGQAVRAQFSPDAARMPTDPVPAATPDPVPAATAGPVAAATPGGAPAAAPDPVAAATPDPVPAATAGPVPAASDRAVPGPSPDDDTDPWAAATAANAAAPPAAPVAPVASSPQADVPQAPFPPADVPPAADAPAAPFPQADVPPAAGTSTAGDLPPGAATAGSNSGSDGPGGTSAGPDWDSARESVRRLGESAQRFATQAGDAARDPELRRSAQRAVTTLSDTLAATVEQLAAELRDRIRAPRFSDPSYRAEDPPVAPTRPDPDQRTP